MGHIHVRFITQLQYEYKGDIDKNMLISIARSWRKPLSSFTSAEVFVRSVPDYKTAFN